MRGQILNMEIVTEFVVEECYACGCLFAMTKHFKDTRLRDKQSFYCPAGHGQQYVGKSDKELRREAEARAQAAEDQAAAAEQARKAAEKATKAAKAEATRLRKRGERGVCPHCKRSFVQLAKHVESKHPECLEQEK